MKQDPGAAPAPAGIEPELDASQVCAVIVTYQPGPELASLVDDLSEQVDKVIIVDNASGGEALQQLERLQERPQLSLQINPTNAGLGAALNQAIRLAIEDGYPWILTLDQDSRPDPGMVSTLLAAVQSGVRREPLAVVAPVLEDRTLGYRYRSLTARSRWFFKRETCETGVLEDVLMVLNSGALHSAHALEHLGGFRADFFIDYLDTEYCLRARLAGYHILVACEARIQHRLGDRQRRRLGPFIFYPTFHSPLRWYTISRNRIPVLRMYMLKFPNWFFFEFFSSLFILLRMLLLEDHRGLKLKALARGTVDGLRRRMGPIPPDAGAMLGKV